MSESSKKAQADADAAQKHANKRGPAGEDPESETSTSATSPDKSGESIEAADTTQDVGATPAHTAKKKHDARDAPTEEDDQDSTS